MTSEREVPYSQRERPIAPLGEQYTPFADWSFELMKDSKVLQNALVEHFVGGVSSQIVTPELGTWNPVGVLIDKGSMGYGYNPQGKFITPNGLIDATKDCDLAVETLRRNPYHLTVHLRRFDVREENDLKVDVILDGENGKVIAESVFGFGMGAYTDDEFQHFTCGTLGFSLPRRKRRYPLMLPQDPEFLRERFHLKVYR